MALLLHSCYEPRPSLTLYSSYNHSTAISREEQYHDTAALPPVGRAVWQLILAMIAKAILTIFTFGMKVNVRCNMELIWGRVPISYARYHECIEHYTVVMPRYEIIYITIITISYHDNHDILNELNILICLLGVFMYTSLFGLITSPSQFYFYNTSRCSKNMYRLRFYVCITK